MRPETREAIQKLLTAMENIKRCLKEGEIKRGMDEFMFCFRNCYTMKETERHMTNKLPSLAPELVTNLFQTFILMISDEESRQAYLKGAQLRAAEANKDQGETSTAKAPTSD